MPGPVDHERQSERVRADPRVICSRRRKCTILIYVSWRDTIGSLFRLRKRGEGDLTHRRSSALHDGAPPISNSMIKLFRSRNRAVRNRAAKLLMNRWRDVPLTIILEILDDAHAEGLGAGVERILLKREDPELVEAMLSRVRSRAPFVREVASRVLGHKGGREITGVLLTALEDPSLMVRRAAGFALSEVRDPSSKLLEHYRASANDDINVRAAIECAFDQLNVDYAPLPEQ